MQEKGDTQKKEFRMWEIDQLPKATEKAGSGRKEQKKLLRTCASSLNNSFPKPTLRREAREKTTGDNKKTASEKWRNSMGGEKGRHGVKNLS